MRNTRMTRSATGQDFMFGTTIQLHSQRMEYIRRGQITNRHRAMLSPTTPNPTPRTTLRLTFAAARPTIANAATRSRWRAVYRTARGRPASKKTYRTGTWSSRMARCRRERQKYVACNLRWTSQMSVGASMTEYVDGVTLTAGDLAKSYFVIRASFIGEESASAAAPARTALGMIASDFPTELARR